MIRRYPDTFALATTAADVERIFKSGHIASLIGMEGGHSINNSIAALRMFYAAGARYMTLTHSLNTDWADSCSDTPKSDGLSPFGEEVVREMNRLGMMVDLSHTSPATMEDAIRVSEAPVIFSHSGARALNDHVRNVPDKVLAMLPKNGGVVMVNFYPPFVTKEGKATLADVADHMDHVRKVAGADHVGIGSDFDGIPTVPVGLEDVSTYPALTAELLRRGWTDDDVKKVLGLNVLRVMQRVEGGERPTAEAARAIGGDHRRALTYLPGRSALDANPRIDQLRVPFREPLQRLHRHTPVRVGAAEAPRPRARIPARHRKLEILAQRPLRRRRALGMARRIPGELSKDHATTNAEGGGMRAEDVSIALGVLQVGIRMHLQHIQP
jgi:microsomal dipeptidase-like Zn-dependent dipeptidase